MQLGGWSTNQSTSRPQQSFPLHPAASTCSDPQPCMSAGPASCGGSAPMPMTSLVCQLSARRAGPAASVASSYALVTGGSPGARSQVSQSTDDTGGHIFGGGAQGRRPATRGRVLYCVMLCNKHNSNTCKRPECGCRGMQRGQHVEGEVAYAIFNHHPRQL